MLLLKRHWRKALLAAALLGSAVLAVGWWYYQDLILRPLANVQLEFGHEERISFLAVGRQGYGNQWTADVAAGMGRVATEHRMHFVVLTGDNFYPIGVASVADPQWQDKFERLYSSASLYDLPFFAVLGNHDHDGNAAARLSYAAERRGTGRWRMRGLQYHQDFGRVDDRVLLRIVFLDTVPMAGRLKRFIGRLFLSKAMAVEGNPVWRVVVGHAGVRSRTQLPFTQRLLLDELEPLMRKLHVDLVLSGNDRFQQVLDVPGEPLHVSTNGGGRQLENGLPEQASDTTFIAVRPGFASVTVDPRSLEGVSISPPTHSTFSYVTHKSAHSIVFALIALIYLRLAAKSSEAEVQTLSDGAGDRPRLRSGNRVRAILLESEPVAGRRCP